MLITRGLVDNTIITKGFGSIYNIISVTMALHQIIYRDYTYLMPMMQRLVKTIPRDCHIEEMKGKHSIISFVEHYFIIRRRDDLEDEEEDE